jgi:hypothetical protein
VLGLALGAAPVVVAVSVAHAAMFGAPWRTGYSFLENKGYEALVTATPLFGIGAPDPLRLATALFSPSVGLFFFCPLLLLGLIAAAREAVRAQDAAVRADAIVVVGVACMALFIAGYGGWRGGWSVGPRYLCELTGLLAFTAARFADGLKHRTVGRVVVAVVVGAGLISSGLPGLMFPHLPDALSNPTAQLVVPLWVRGFAPEGLALWALGSPRAASVLLMMTLWLPLGVVVVRARAPFVLPAAVGGAALLLGLCAVLPVPLARVGAEALEARRMFDNWRPWRGNPYVAPALAVADDDKAVNERLDPRIALAVDRARVALPRLLREGCAPANDPVAVPAADGSQTATALAQALSQGVIAVDGLVVVDDALALAIGPVHGRARASAPVIATRSDVARFAKDTLPCAGPVWVVSTTERPVRGAGAVVQGPFSLGSGYTLVGRAR